VILAPRTALAEFLRGFVRAALDEPGLALHSFDRLTEGDAAKLARAIHVAQSTAQFSPDRDW
jgi:hypothetical protein